MTSSADDGMFRLELRTPTSAYSDLDAIEPVATVTYLGPEDVALVTHAARMVGFRIEQLDGKRTMDGGMDSVCVSSVLDRDRPVTQRFEKAGQPTDDQVAGFDAAWYADESLQLPPGSWRITATLDVSTDGCGGIQHTISATNDITVARATRGAAPVIEASEDTTFRLELTTPHGVYPEGVPIEAVATVAYLGPNASETMYHAGSPLSFSIDEVGGTRRMDEIMTMPCHTTPIFKAEPRSYPFRKGVGTDPFDATWSRDPVLRLPAGTWRLRAALSVDTNGCGGGSHTLVADNVIIVTGGLEASIAPVSPTPDVRASPTLAPPNPEPEPSVAPSTVEDSAFRLQIRSATTEYLATEPVEIEAILTDVGGADAMRFGHGDPAVSFSIQQLDGRESMNGLVADICVGSSMTRGESQNLRFVRSGPVEGIFTEQWYRDPELRLPAGTWYLTATLDAYVPDCGLESDVHHLTAGIVIIVR